MYKNPLSSDEQPPNTPGLHKQQINLVYDALPTSLFVSAFSALLVSYLLWGTSDSRNIIIWLALLLLVSLFRLITKTRYTKSLGESLPERDWGRLFLYGALLAGLTWGSGSYLLFPLDSMIHQSFLAFIVGGLAAASITTLSPLYPAATSFLIAALSPLIWRFLSAGHPLSLSMAGMLLLFLGMMLVIARRNNRITAKVLWLHALASEQTREIEKSHGEKNLLLESAAEGIFGVDSEGIITFVNASASRMLGYPSTALIGQPAHDLLHHSQADGSDYPVDHCPMSDTIKRGEVHHIDNEVLWREDGSSFHVDYHSTPMIREDKVIGAMISFHDITQRREAQLALVNERRLFMAGPTVVFTWEADPDMPVSYVSPNIYKQFGHSVDSLTSGKTPFLDLIHSEDKHHFIAQLKDHADRHSGHFEIEFRLLNATNEYRWIYVLLTIDYNEFRKTSRYHGYVLDITQRKQAEAQAEYQAYYDPLTSLFNRRLLLSRLTKDLARSRRHGHFGALLFLDLDRFKTINDSLGHAVGDALLKEVSKRLLENLRDEDTAARLGGDEFVILLSEVSNDEESAVIQAQGVAEKMRVFLAEPYEINGNHLHVTASIGITLFPEEGHTAEDLLKHSDIAMYRAKEQGRNATQFFLPSMQQAAHDRLIIEKDLRLALEREEFALFCQSQVGRGGELLGGECLIRWKHPQQGMISPTRFIPIAEETGLILQIGEWVIREACSLTRRWVTQGILLPGQHISVNVSAFQFRQKTFMVRVREIFAESGVDPSYLIFELTEGVVLADVKGTVRKMEQLRELGVKIALDDFGTGYSSLSYLKTLPLSTLKIDRSFVMDIDSDPNDAAIVQTIISMARHLDLNVIAEGVETEQHHIFLQSCGCDSYQGFLFSRPEPMEVFKKRLCTHAGIDSDENQLVLVKS